MPRYSSPWKSLPEALDLLTGTGMAKNDAKSDLCSALADRQIEFRAMVETAEEEDGPYPGSSGETTIERYWLSRHQVRIPPGLEPEELDWERSRPISNWLTTFNEAMDDDHRI